jgi:ribosomal protein S18 acetylase RimI-like enzyme
MTLRKLPAEDLDGRREVFELQLLSYQREADLIQYQNLPPLRESLAEFIATNDQTYVYSTNGSVVGAILFSQNFSRLSINKLIVDPHHFRQGIGRSLLMHLLRNFSFTTCHVSTSAKNIPALQLYLSCGFLITKTEIVEENLELAHLEMHKE